MTLSPSFLKAAHGKPHPKQRLLPDRDGLSVRISPKGKIAYQMRFTFNKKQSTLTLGHYPAMSLAEARQECLNYQSELKQKGINPSVIKKALIARNSDEFTFDEIYKKWFRREMAGQVIRAENHQGFYNNHVKPEYGDLPVHMITKSMWIDLLDRIRLEKKAPTVAAVLLSDIKRVLSYAEKIDAIEVNPLHAIQPHRDLKIKRKNRKRFLTDDEIRLVMRTARDHFCEKKWLYFKLTFLLGCRCNETRTLHIDNIDFNAKVLKTTHKMQTQTGEMLERPITPLIETLLRRSIALASNDYLFTRPDGQLWTEKQAGYLSTAIKKRLTAEGISIPDWTMHDLRRTTRTKASKFTDFITAEKMLGHGLKGVHAIYDQDDYFDSMTDAYEKWGEILTGLAA